MVAIINYIGNIGSVKNALDYLEIPNFIADKPDDLEKATHIIIPGVGNWSEGAKKLKPFYKYLKSTNKPILGICLGYQLLCNSSEEGSGKGVGLIDAEVKDIGFQHVGWEYVLGKSFYFVHRYGVKSNTDGRFISMYSDKNITGLQMHPEKSQTDGLAFIKEWYEANNSSFAIERWSHCEVGAVYQNS